MHCARGPIDRRAFLRRMGWGIAGTMLLGMPAKAAESGVAVEGRSALALTHGDSRADNVYQALKRIEPQIREGLARKKRVIIKPNMVMVDRQLTSTHADCIEGILEFLGPLVKEDVLVAESPANGPAAEGYANYNYLRLQKEYKVQFVGLDDQPFEILHMVNERHHPRPVRVSKLLLDPEAYLISSAVMKTHDRVVVTLGLKNLVVGAIIKDVGYRWGAGSKGVNDKPLVHGGPQNQGIHFNLFDLSKRIHPDLTVLDGFEGMEHNGPNDGTPVDHRIALASTDWLAVDRVGAHLMGFDFNRIGYMKFCSDAGMGQTDLSRLDVLGEPIDAHVRPYQPHDSIEQQYQWM